ncbi:MAG: permease [Spirochaetes bacterium]|uniref:Permease n=1 Tax=Candidatus Avitreponema avistercoris TaxID=2840705 RepID=A0A9D9ELH2_9SPIR|nr:permease [Candidatus Avitreponema avistercoris]
MESVAEILQREAVYLWYYFDLQIRQIFWYWLFGILGGSLISVFLKGKLHEWCRRAGEKLSGPAGWLGAAVAGIVSPLCMYGTVPIAASFSQKGIRDDFLAAFMVCSVLLNPQLVIYSTALGPVLLPVRIAGCFFCGILAGFLVRVFYVRAGRTFFCFGEMAAAENRDTDPDPARRLLKNIWRNVRATGPMFLLGIVLSVLFQRYVPADAFASLFGRNEGFGVLLAAGMGVPLYVCGGGTIPLMIQWLHDGMSAGAAAAFMLSGPATKITNLGALKTALPVKHFTLYLGYIILFSLLCGFLVNSIFS